MIQPAKRASSARILAIILLLLVATLGCTSVGRMVVAPTPTPTATALPTLLPTSTVTPTATLTPTPTFTPTGIPTETPTPLPSTTPTLTLTPVPIAEARVLNPSVNVRSGPSIRFSRIGEVRQDEVYSIISTDPSGIWWELCCLEGGQSGWVRGDLIAISGPLNEIEVATINTPTPIPTSTFTPVPPTATPPPLFYRGEGPIFMPTNNNWVTLWVKVYDRALLPVDGWRLQVTRDGIVAATSQPSLKFFQYSAPEGTQFGNRVQYNIKLEIQNPGTATWQVYLIDGAEVVQSPIVDFTTQPGNERREIYIGFLSAR